MKQLIFIPILLSSVFVKAPTPLKREAFKSFSMSPLCAGETTYIKMEFNAAKSLEVSYDIYIENDVGKYLIVSDAQTTFTTVTYTYDNKYTRSNNTVIIDYWLNSKGSSVSHEAFTNISKKEIVGDDKTLVSNTDILCFSPLKSWYTEKETITFYGFEELYIPKYYHKLDISDFKFKTDNSSGAPLICEGQFLISNNNGVFNALNSDEEYARLKLKCALNGNFYELKFDENLFVNRETLKMGNRRKLGYVKTEHLFLPINEMKNQNEYECTIILTKLGIDRDKLTFSFKYNALLNVIGDCHNSEYCVVVNEK